MYSRDAIFLEDQRIDNFKKPNKPKSSRSSPIDSCLDTFLRSLDDGGATVDDNIDDSHEAEESTDGIQNKPHAKSPA